ncbi:hypothetical protein AAHH78_39945, partial [Burkholderia pseudomallei]
RRGCARGGRHGSLARSGDPGETGGGWRGTGGSHAFDAFASAIGRRMTFVDGFEYRRRTANRELRIAICVWAFALFSYR